MMAVGKKEFEEQHTDSQGIKRMLRDDAEEQLAHSPKRSSGMEGQTPEQLIHELEVHQIELETQAEELRRAHIAVVESRDKYLDLYEFAPVSYFTLNDKALIEEVNLAGATLLGTDRKKLVNARFRKFIAQTDSEQWIKYFMDVLDQENKQTCTLMLKRSDGSMFPARLESNRITSSDAAPTVRVTVSDITDIKKAEKALGESEEKYRALFAAESDGIFVVDKESGTIIECNDAITPMYGYRKDEVIGQLNTAMSAEPEATRAATHGVKSLIPIRYHRRKDGSVFPVEIAASVVSVKGHDAIVAAVRDITERKVAEEALRQSEEKLSHILNDITDVVWSLSWPDMKVYYISPSAEKLVFPQMD